METYKVIKLSVTLSRGCNRDTIRFCTTNLILVLLTVPAVPVLVLNTEKKKKKRKKNQQDVFKLKMPQDTAVLSGEKKRLCYAMSHTLPILTYRT